MPRSMTGYGSGQAKANGRNVTVELRSVNNRFLDLSFRLPHLLFPYEPELRELISKRLKRGRVVIQVTEEWQSESSPAIKIDKVKANYYFNALKELQQELSLQGGITLDNIVSFGDIISSEVGESYGDELWELTREATDTALEKLIINSEAEGLNLSRDIVRRIGKVQTELEEIKVLMASQVELYKERLQSRLEDILNDTRIDSVRLETEIALVADRLDISEEIVRFESHIELFNKSLQTDKTLGKTLGFVLQEMGREANTIASKSWLIDISQSAIKIKEILEQVREQVQNLE